MPRKLSKEGKDFNKLRGLGYEFKSQDYYSEQPDSGGTIGGLRGKQEYGIESTLDSGGKRGLKEAKLATNVPAFEREEPGSVKDIVPEQISRDLMKYIAERLGSHPALKDKFISVSAETKNSVLVEGIVTSESDKIRVTELIEAIIPNTDIHNNLEISTHI